MNQFFISKSSFGSETFSFQIFVDNQKIFLYLANGENLTTQAVTFDLDHNVQHMVSRSHHRPDISMFINCDDLSRGGVDTTRHTLTLDTWSDTGIESSLHYIVDL